MLLLLRTNDPIVRRRLFPVAGAMTLVVLLASCATVPRSTQTPRVRLTAMQVTLDRAGEDRIDVIVQMDNLNDFPLPVEGLTFTARIGGEGYVDGRHAVPFTIAALDTQQITVAVESERISSPSRLLTVAEGNPGMLPYELKGELVVGGRPPRSLSFIWSDRVPLATATPR